MDSAELVDDMRETLDTPEMVPPEQKVRRKIYTRSALNRRSTYIEPIAKEEPKNTPYAYLDLADNLGFTALHRAVVMKQYNVCQQLLSKGVDVNKPAYNGMNALLLASRHGDVTSVQVLLTSENINVNAKDKNGWTALHHCAVNNHLLIAEMLMVVGANPHSKAKKGEMPIDIAPMEEMKDLLDQFMKDKQNRIKEEKMKCVMLTKKSDVMKSELLGLELEFPKAHLRSTLFFIIKRIPAACNAVELGHSEIMISDVYEFWPSTVHFTTSVTVQIDCVPTNAGEEVVLKMERDREVPIFKDKSQSMYVNKRGQSAVQRNGGDNSSETARKFSLHEFTRFYVVSRLPKETSKIPLIGGKIQHSSGPQLSITVPKNGLNSESNISLQLYPVELDLVKQMQKQYLHIVSMGSICEVTHTDTEPMTRRLVTMTVPLPEDYQVRKFDGRLVVVSGTEDDNQLPEVIEKCFVENNSAGFLTRYLTWKVAMLVRQVDVQVLSEVAQLVRKSTRKRMHFVTYLPMYKTDLDANTLTLNLTVVDVANEAQAVSELIKQGFSQTQLIKKVANQMLCEGERSHLKLKDEKTALAVAYFNKHISCRAVTIPLPKSRVIQFSIQPSTSSSVLIEGEAYA